MSVTQFCPDSYHGSRALVPHVDPVHGGDSNCALFPWSNELPLRCLRQYMAPSRGPRSTQTATIPQSGGFAKIHPQARLMVEACLWHSGVTSKRIGNYLCLDTIA